MKIGENIKKIRKEKKLTQVQLAKIMGISRSHLSDVENDRYNPSYKTLERFSKELKVSMLYLTTGNKQMSDMGVDIEKLTDDIMAHAAREETKTRNAEMKLDLKKGIEEILSSELTYSQTLYFTNALSYLNHSSEEDIKTLAAIMTNLIRYHETGEDDDINQAELLEFIETETEFFKEFLKKRYHYKEGE